MFKDVDENIRMLKGAYKKLKSYYYYNKNFILMRKKIADFENDHKMMDHSFEEMAKAIQHPSSKFARNYFDNLLQNLDFYVIPKQFDSRKSSLNDPVSNTIQRDKRMKSVNFFVDAPVEVHIFDTLWTVLLAKMDYDLDVVSADVYGNTINESVLFGPNDKISFDCRNLFYPYFNKYTDWRNNAFHAMEMNYDTKHDTVLVSLDVKSYFYSIRFNFDSLKVLFSDHELLNRIRSLTGFIKKLYDSYLTVIKPYRKDLLHFCKNEYLLPIGLFSSMFIGNLYLKDFDSKVKTIKGIQYYGRYVDDILIVVRKTINDNDSNKKIIDSLFVKSGILLKKGGNYSFVGYKSLFVQPEKIKIIYIDHTESKALIDIYNRNIRIIPSQMDPLPFTNMEMTSFDEKVYSIENFSKENKIRDIGFLGVDTFNVGLYFSLLPRRYAHLMLNDSYIKKEIKRQLIQIDKFYTGSQMIEFYSNWLNYLYFLVLIQNTDRIRSFMNKAKMQIKALKAYSLDIKTYNQRSLLNKKAKDALLNHLDICLDISFSIDVIYAKKYFNEYYALVKKYISSNMFEHSYVAFPLANYLNYTKDVSFSKMRLSDINRIPNKLSNCFKFIWSPRFIHYDEILLMKFYYYHIKHKESNYFSKNGELEKEFSEINCLGYLPFNIKKKIISKFGEYTLEKIVLPNNAVMPERLKFAVGSVDITEQKCINGFNRWGNLTLQEKEQLYKILKDSYMYNELDDRVAMVLVLPELYFPIYWINDLIRFAKKTQIAIVTGLQYIGDETNRKYNYLATILPFISGSKDYRNACVYIREKNDYSPIEIENLAKYGVTCCNKLNADYNVFHWNGIRLTPILCYELTDIVARAILKGNSDILSAVECNPDTNYFSNIIDSASRDLHAFIIQANSSQYGDSRVTGPYDRNNKDIFKIKGGENDYVVIGSVDYKKLKMFQENYYIDFEKRLAKIEIERKKEKPKYPKKKKEQPDIKPLPARFRNI